MEKNVKDPIPLYLFSKSPEPGLVKTRMQPSLSVRHSVELATMMLEETMIKVSEQWPGERVLAAAPDVEHPVLRALAARYRFRMEPQIEGDLGMKMRHVLRQGTLRSQGAVVMGSDVPQIPEFVISDAHEQISKGINVVGPALDGGFYLLGLVRCVEGIFEDIEWSTGAVFSSLKKNAASRGIVLVEQLVLRDIDSFDDLAWLASQDARYRQFLSAGSVVQ